MSGYWQVQEVFGQGKPYLSAIFSARGQD